MSDDPASHDAFKWEQRTAQVQRLRTPLDGVDYTVNAERTIAALTIYNLMFEVKELNEEMLQLRQQVTELRGERDEARRMVCGMNESGLRMNDSDKQREAKRRGWDCFKEKP